MHPYGLPKNENYECPDFNDVKRFGLKTSSLWFRWSAKKGQKRKIRRYWKRLERQKTKKIIAQLISMHYCIEKELI